MINLFNFILVTLEIKFSENMSDDEFFMYLKNEHISDRDRVCLNGKY